MTLCDAVKLLPKAEAACFSLQDLGCWDKQEDELDRPFLHYYYKAQLVDSLEFHT